MTRKEQGSGLSTVPPHFKAIYDLVPHLEPGYYVARRLFVFKGHIICEKATAHSKGSKVVVHNDKVSPDNNGLGVAKALNILADYVSKSPRPQELADEIARNVCPTPPSNALLLIEPRADGIKCKIEPENTPDNYQIKLSPGSMPLIQLSFGDFQFNIKPNGDLIVYDTTLQHPFVIERDNILGAAIDKQVRSILTELIARFPEIRGLNPIMKIINNGKYRSEDFLPQPTEPVSFESHIPDEREKFLVAPLIIDPTEHPILIDTEFLLDLSGPTAA